MASGRVGIGGARVGLAAGPSGFVEGLVDAWSSDSLKLKASLSFFCLPLLFNRCLSSRSIPRGFSTTRFVLEFSYIALSSTRRWPFLEVKPAEFWFGGGVGGGGWWWCVVVVDDGDGCDRNEREA
jgi:hypothetical protein